MVRASPSFARDAAGVGSALVLEAAGAVAFGAVRHHSRRGRRRCGGGHRRVAIRTRNARAPPAVPGPAAHDFRNDHAQHVSGWARDVPIWPFNVTFWTFDVASWTLNVTVWTFHVTC